jgi:hypothetical protein
VPSEFNGAGSVPGAAEDGPVVTYF